MDEKQKFTVADADGGETREQKIQIVKQKIATVKQIEKLQKEIARLEKNIAAKKAKIEELADTL